MIYKNHDEEAKVQNQTPIKITPLTDDFREELYYMYKVYRPQADRNDYSYNA